MTILQAEKGQIFLKKQKTMTSRNEGSEFLFTLGQ